MVSRNHVKEILFALALAPMVYGGATFVASEVKGEVNFAGKRIVWIVPTREGGGSDNFTRALANFFPKYLPGSPTIVVRNIPGAGTVPGHNFFMQNAKPDGLMLITASASASLNQVLNNKAVKYDLTKYKTVLATPQGTFIYAHPSTGVKKPSDVKKLVNSGKIYRYGGYGPTSSDIRVLIAFDLLGIKLKPLWGISRGQTRQAFMRGETDLNYDTASSWLKKVMPLVKKNQAIPLFNLGLLDDKGQFIRDPNAPQLPILTEVYEQIHGKKLSGAALDTWRSLISLAVMTSKSINLAPGTSQEIVDTYVEAMKKTIDDPKFKKVRKKRIGAYKPLFGKEASKSLASAVSMTPTSRKWLITFLKTKYDVDIDK